MEETINFEIHENTLIKWQKIVNLASTLLGIPAAMIMRINKGDLEVLATSANENNPYSAGQRTPFHDSGIYCERVIKTNMPLIVEDAEDHTKWNQSFAIKNSMISYLGFPILLPDKKPFGTICIQDNKTNHFSQAHIDLMENFRDVIQSHIEVMHMNTELGEKNKTLSQFIEEIKMLRGIVTICSNCKKIRNKDGNWEMMETFIERRSEASFSHSLCTTCADQLYGHKEWYQKMKSEDNRET